MNENLVRQDWSDGTPTSNIDLCVCQVLILDLLDIL